MEKGPPTPNLGHTQADLTPVQAPKPWGLCWLPPESSGRPPKSVQNHSFKHLPQTPFPAPLHVRNVRGARGRAQTATASPIQSRGSTCAL